MSAYPGRRGTAEDLDGIDALAFSSFFFLFFVALIILCIGVFSTVVLEGGYLSRRLNY